MRPGDRVALVAPASPLPDDEIANALENVRALGCTPVLGEHARARTGYLAGNDEQRAADFNAALYDPQIRAIFALRGGYGVMRILDLIDYDAVRNDPKIVLGYSDMTALLNAIAQRSGSIAFHGPMMHAPLSAQSRERILRALADPRPLDAVDLPDVISSGSARGPLRGGNLSLIAHLCGTPFAIESAGGIVFIEDVGESAYRIDRMLTQLRLAGWFSCAAAVLAGDVEHLDVVRERLATLSAPAYAGLAFGHIDEQLILPIGVNVEIDGASARMRFVESAVA